MSFMVQSVFMYFVAFLSKAVNRYEKTNPKQKSPPYYCLVQDDRVYDIKACLSSFFNNVECKSFV